MTAASDGPPGKLIHLTPLRYPGGKGKLANYVKRLMKANGLLDGDYVEPYAGGAAVALELLLHEYVAHIYINDVSRPIYAFWRSVLTDTEAFCRRIVDTPLTIDTWRRQKAILMASADHDDSDLGFATFFLNRTNRSGILNGGVIGGLDQSGPWKIDARYNAAELVRRIEAIARVARRISLTRQDALEFLSEGVGAWPSRTLVYLDPPYYLKGNKLYYNYYKHDDHVRIAAFVREKIMDQKWIVSYDNVPAVRDLYEGAPFITYDIAYSARSARQGSEIMYFKESLRIPDPGGAMTPLEQPRLIA